MSTPPDTPAGAASVTVNGEERALPGASATLAAFLRHMDFEPEQPGIAVAVEGEVVRREEWAERTLQGGEAVEIITAQQGG